MHDGMGQVRPETFESAKIRSSDTCSSIQFYGWACADTHACSDDGSNSRQLNSYRCGFTPSEAKRRNPPSLPVFF